MALLSEEILLLEGIRNGEEWAFKQLFNNYYSALCNYVYKHFIDRNEAENIVQEVLLSMYENRESIEKVQNLKAYLFRSVHYQCVNYIKREQVRKRFEDEESYQLKLIELELEPDESSEEKIASILEAIEELPEQQKKAFTLKRIYGKSYKEISAELDIAERTVETHISLALKYLRKKLLPVRASKTASAIFFIFSCITYYGIYSSIFTTYI